MATSNMNSSGGSTRGFAQMIKNDPQRQKAIASKGGSMSPGNFKNDRKRASEAGRRGGSASSRGSSS
jgi:general stress protein YciG